jgi:hypothetical protein
VSIHDKKFTSGDECRASVPVVRRNVRARHIRPALPVDAAPPVAPEPGDGPAAGAGRLASGAAMESRARDRSRAGVVRSGLSRPWQGRQITAELLDRESAGIAVPSGITEPALPAELR